MPFGVILKSALPSAPDYWTMYTSATGTGNPDTNPGSWTLFDFSVPSTSLPSYWAGESALTQVQPWFICNYSLLGVTSLWSPATM